MTPEQCRMARAALEWSLDDLSTHSGMGRITIHKYEKGGDAFVSTIHKLKTTFEETGKIRFQDDCCVCIEKDG